jgi:hypothetical protein
MENLKASPARILVHYSFAVIGLTIYGGQV